MKDWGRFAIGIILGGITCLGSAFERIDYRSLPFSDSWFDESGPVKADEFSRDLASIALGSGLSDYQKARLLAAARRVSPLNKEVFFTEYNLALGNKSSNLVPIPHEKISDTLAPYMKLLSGKPNSMEFFAFISQTLDFDAATLNLARKQVYSVTDQGYSKLWADFRPIEASHFEFVPNSNNSATFLSAYRESLKYLSLNVEAKLSGWRIQFTDESEGDGGKSAALPCAVLTRAFLDQIELDSEVAYIGDVNADGTVQPVGDLYLKLQDPDSNFARVTIIPNGDVSSLNDVWILAGPKIFASTQVFSVDQLIDAIELGKKSRTVELAESISLFGEVQKILTGPNGGKTIYSSQVKKLIARVLALQANHQSARYLKAISEKRFPRYLSLGCTMEMVNGAKDAIHISDHEKYRLGVASLEEGTLDDTYFTKLKRYRSRINPALWKLADALIAYHGGSRLGIDRLQLKKNVWNEFRAVNSDVRIQQQLNQ